MGAFSHQRVVWDSALQPHLKLVALAMLSFADTDGRNIYPSVARVAAMVGKSARAVQTDIAALITNGFLVMESAGGGRAKTARYRFVKGEAHFGVLNSEAHFTDSSKKPRSVVPETVKPSAETTKPTTENHEAHFTRSIHDQTIDQTMDHTPAPPARALHVHTRPGEPAGAEVYAAIANRIVANFPDSTNIAEAKEAMKGDLARQRIAYDGSLVAEAIEQAFTRRDAIRRRFFETARPRRNDRRAATA